MTPWHYSAGSISDIQSAGFNLADVGSVAGLNALPDGMKGIVWTPNNPGNTPEFQAFVTPFIGNPKLFAFRLTDEPDPLGRFGKPRVTWQRFKEETDWLHSLGAKAFTVLMDLGSYEVPSLSRDGIDAYTPANTGLDYIGLDPYPIRGLARDIEYITRMVNAAKAVGWQTSQIIPVHQAFGGGTYTTTTAGQTDRYVLPSPAQADAMFKKWDELLPSPAFDMAWTYETKSGIRSIAGTSAAELALRQAFKEHNTYVPAPPVTPVAELLRAKAKAIDAGTLTAKTYTVVELSDGSVIRG